MWLLHGALPESLLLTMAVWLQLDLLYLIMVLRVDKWAHENIWSLYSHNVHPVPHTLHQAVCLAYCTFGCFMVHFQSYYHSLWLFDYNLISCTMTLDTGTESGQMSPWKYMEPPQPYCPSCSSHSAPSSLFWLVANIAASCGALPRPLLLTMGCLTTTQLPVLHELVAVKICQYICSLNSC